MSSPSSVISMGYGSWGNNNLVLTLGYGNVGGAISYNHSLIITSASGSGDGVTLSGSIDVTLSGSDDNALSGGTA